MSSIGCKQISRRRTDGGSAGGSTTVNLASGWRTGMSPSWKVLTWCARPYVQSQVPYISKEIQFK